MDSDILLDASSVLVFLIGAEAMIDQTRCNPGPWFQGHELQKRRLDSDVRSHMDLRTHFRTYFRTCFRTQIRTPRRRWTDFEICLDLFRMDSFVTLAAVGDASLACAQCSHALDLSMQRARGDSNGRQWEACSIAFLFQARPGPPQRCLGAIVRGIAHPIASMGEGVRGKESTNVALFAALLSPPPARLRACEGRRVGSRSEDA